MDPKGLCGGLPGGSAVPIHQGCCLLPTHSSHLHQLPGENLPHRLGLGSGESCIRSCLELDHSKEDLGRGSTLFLMAPVLKSLKVRSEQRGFGEGPAPDSGSPGAPQGRLCRV